MGVKAKAALPDLIALLNDADSNVRFMAERALWVDPEFAAKRANWQRFKSERWSFSAQFPEFPKEDRKPRVIAGEEIQSIWFLANSGRGALNCAIVIAEEPIDLTRDKVLDFLAGNGGALMVGLNMQIRDAKYRKLDKFDGREIVAAKPNEFGGETILNTRQFWINGRLFVIQATYNSKFTAGAEAAYFLDSFKFHDPPAR